MYRHFFLKQKVSDWEIANALFSTGMIYVLSLFARPESVGSPIWLVLLTTFEIIIILVCLYNPSRPDGYMEKATDYELTQRRVLILTDRARIALALGFIIIFIMKIMPTFSMIK